MQLVHMASRLYGTPLLIARSKLDVILSALGPRIGLPDVEAAVPAVMPARPEVAAPPGITVIPIHGTLVRRTLALEAASGLMSYGEIGSLLEAALADPAVSGILLDVDSPGGEASGSFDLARRVREASAVKPVWAIADDAAFSAAYAIGCAAQRLYVTETGGVGSIGVIAVHVDQSAKDAQDGYRYTAVTAGAHKNDYSPHEPLGDAARSALHTEVDRLYGLFAAHVSAMRALDEQAVRDTQAGLFFGPNAIAAGLADAVGTLDSALSEFSIFLSSRGARTPTARAASRRGAQKETLMSDLSTETKDAPVPTLSAEQLDQARRDVTQSTRAIAEMCLIADCPERAAEFIAAGHTEAQVRSALIEARAQRSAQTAVQSTHAPEEWSGTDSQPGNSPVVAAVKKLVAKE